MEPTVSCISDDLVLSTWLELVSEEVKQDKRKDMEGDDGLEKQDQAGLVEEEEQSPAFLTANQSLIVNLKENSGEQTWFIRKYNIISEII